MRRDDLITTIRAVLDKTSTYRSDAFLISQINYGQKLICTLTLFYEQRDTVSITGGRNYIPLPKEGNDSCIAPLYVANTNTGARVNYVSIDEMEFYATQWEGRNATDSLYYTLLNPFHDAFSCIVVCPYQTAETMEFSFVGAYEHNGLSSDSAEPVLPEEYQDLLVLYTIFQCFIGEPNRVKDALASFKQFMTRLNQYIASLKARFPSGRDFEPYSTEFSYDIITEQEQTAQKVEKKNER